jgi:hypothetical protein
MRDFMSYPRTECSCDLCAINCLFIPGYLLPEDLAAIRSFLGCSDLVRFAEENFLASPGALVVRACPGSDAGAGELLRIPTIVPARSEQGWCKFFDGKLCKIHPVAPFGCAFFDSHLEPGHSLRISSYALMSIAEQWRNEASSVYCMFWRHLHLSGLTAPSPEESRRRMLESIPSKHL